MADQSAHVIDKRDQISLAVFSLGADRGAVHDVGLPDVVGEFGLVAAPIHRRLLSLHEPLTVEEPPHRALGQVLFGIDQAALLSGADQAAYGGPGHFSS
jgi:hypothetical protein